MKLSKNFLILCYKNIKMGEKNQWEEASLFVIVLIYCITNSALTVALNHKQIKSHSERISKIRPFIDQYNWKEIDFPSQSKDWKKFEENNETIALNILFLPHNTEKIRFSYKSKHNFKRENQVILVMITDGKKWHYLTVKGLSALLRGVTSNDHGDFYCLNCFHS